MKSSSVRRRCAVALHDVEVPDPFSLDAFCELLEMKRGRGLHLHPFRVSGVGTVPCGVYLSTKDDDHIFFDARTSPLHRDHIVLHEISHMLLDHGTDRRLHETLGRLMPSIDQRTLETVLGRTSYSTQQEQEAETLATLIAGATRTRTRPVGAGATQDPVLGRLHTTLGHVSAGGRGR